ncbi:hypothetical protein HMPREF0294_0747 [Corynebacterium glucuronolyticum ATCC 51867]|nr:hypothetical protein HMPREF0294_0747 [Corynebacterium glucuronolyticum ATCC 51867]
MEHARTAGTNDEGSWTDAERNEEVSFSKPSLSASSCFLTRSILHPL